MEQLNEAAAAKELLNGSPNYSFPSAPFENIGFALSGGGFRAAVYGLGVLSLMNEIKLEDGKTLLEKIGFVSSASGGTLVLAPYVASLHHGLPFQGFYRHILNQTTGEGILQKAIALLNDENQWPQTGKSRNIINAFAKAYDDCLFSFIPDVTDRNLSFIMKEESGNTTVHLKEFCFNATEFFTGISFRFQGGESWGGKGDAPFGNANIKVAGKDEEREKAVAALKTIKLADVTAASSCFPLGFEPILFPKDFASDASNAQQLKDAVQLLTNSWNGALPEEQNAKSKRAVEEHAFVIQKEFALMDGGICDNQGLLSLLLANGRNIDGSKDGNNENRFDLMMVSDVTSYFMKPYKESAFKLQGNWLNQSLDDYWHRLRRLYKKVQNALTLSWIAVAVLSVCCAAPFMIEGPSVAAWILTLLCLGLIVGTLWARYTVRKAEAMHPAIARAFAQAEPKGLISLFIKKDSFAGRTALKVTDYLSHVPTRVLFTMLMTRLQSAETMVVEVFLKQVRRLIYELLYKNDRYLYRRLANPIYKLAFTNQKNLASPRFEPIENEDRANYLQRQQQFVQEVKGACRITDSMQTTAEKAYNMGTTLWFEEGDGADALTFQHALLATGQFTTCYNLLAYTLGLKHSRHFANLERKYQDRMTIIETQLKDLMCAFANDPFYLCKQLESRQD